MRTIPFKPRDPETRTDGTVISWPMKRLTIEIGIIGCDLAFLLIGHRVDFGLRRFGINDAINAQTALYADH
jgi:hypothetical protein